MEHRSPAGGCSNRFAFLPSGPFAFTVVIRNMASALQQRSATQGSQAQSVQN
jgi:hypothetical protein